MSDISSQVDSDESPDVVSGPVSPSPKEMWGMKGMWQKRRGVKMLSLDRFKVQAATIPTVQRSGRVTAVRGLTVLASGPAEAVGQCCDIQTRSGAQPALVVGFGPDGVMLQPLGESLGIAPGDEVVALNHGLEITVGPELLGRVLDGLGQPIDGLGPLRGQAKRPAEASRPRHSLAVPFSRY